MNEEDWSTGISAYTRPHDDDDDDDDDDDEDSKYSPVNRLVKRL